ncbi:hypothetical protein CPB83DRAFT_647994 [Crepidotus variabilis]|uniref:Protein BZZ1 n=1 Tax=Crepidotus variabilis TaxID=179855 RepID=A0A9P6E758_9AGAR|nr:hypothetical protein CPB83DRAFT_647994 [Crepidotus variabilis]
MKEITGGQQFGQTLPDQVEKIAEFFDSHVEVIGDVRDIYLAKAALAREYAVKLQSLARKSAEKKEKSQALFVVGREPTKAWDESVLKRSTLDAAYDEIIASLTKSAQDHTDHADKLSGQTVETLRILQQRNSETKKKEMAFFQKLLSDRDRIFNERIKSKQKYDDDCSEVESFRQKQGRASDDKHADRAAKQAEQQRNDMLNSKNSYLISNEIANRVKDKFYQEDLPQIENELQTLHRRLVDRFVRVLVECQKAELNSLESLKFRLSDVSSKLQLVDPSKDQDLFIGYNLRAFSAPEDWKFEPCSIHYDTDSMSIETAPKIVIQNKLRRSKEKLNELIPLMETKSVESKDFYAKLTAFHSENSVGPIDDLTDRFLDAEHQVVHYATSERILKAEIDTILAAVGNDQGASMPHAFKSSSFSIPTQCGYCETTIWGLSKQGRTCKACGLSVHSKCELKVAANCEASKGQPSSMIRKSTSLARSAAPAVAPTASSFVQSTNSDEPADESGEAVALFEYVATSEFELHVREGEKVRITEQDDGSGWVKVVNKDGDSGLVPASYIDDSIEVTRGPSQGAGERVRVLYPYNAQGSDELDLRQDEILELSPGGKDYGNGWWEGFDVRGRRGIFPSNYVELL